MTNRTRWNYSDEIKWREFILAAVAVAWVTQSYCTTSAVVYEGFISICNVMYIKKNIAQKKQKQTNRKKSNKIREICGTGNNRAQSLTDN